jgi:hypothetical protein
MMFEATQSEIVALIGQPDNVYWPTDASLKNGNDSLFDLVHVVSGTCFLV